MGSSIYSLVFLFQLLGPVLFLQSAVSMAFVLMQVISVTRFAGTDGLRRIALTPWKLFLFFGGPCTCLFGSLFAVTLFSPALLHRSPVNAVRLSLAISCFPGVIVIFLLRAFGQPVVNSMRHASAAVAMNQAGNGGVLTAAAMRMERYLALEVSAAIGFIVMLTVCSASRVLHNPVGWLL